MKLRIAVLAVTIPLLAGVVSVWFSANRDASIEDSPASTVAPTERPVRLRDPILRPPAVAFPEEPDVPVGPEVTSADVEDIRMRMLASIAEDFRTAIEVDIERSVSRFGANSAQSEELSRYWTDPAWPTIPALPGVSGFEIQQCPRSQCLSDRLAREPDDPAWARPMESRILAELSGYAETGLTQVFVVCRQHTCGILLPALEDTASRLNLNLTGSALGSELGFPNHSVADRSEFQAIFLTTREQSPEMWVQ